MSDWDPDLYHRFRAERRMPFFDLLALVERAPGAEVVDLGCGTGELTRELHARTGAVSTLGIDRSAAMLERTREHSTPGLTFELGELETALQPSRWDLLFSNAALQWSARHDLLFPRIASAVRPGGQLAMQVPANHDHPAHRLAAELASEEPYRDELGGFEREWSVLAPERYAELLYAAGYSEPYVVQRVYGHVLPGPAAVVDWMRSTYLRPYSTRLSGASFEAYTQELEQRIVDWYGNSTPFFFTFKRILAWGRRT